MEGESLSIGPVELVGRRCRPGEPVRVAVRYEDSWRIIFWMSVGKDGDVLFGPRFKGKRPWAWERVQVPEGATSVSINYADAKDVGDDAGKVTMHTSGITNTPGGNRVELAALRELDRQREVGMLLFDHPRNFPPVDALRPRDVPLRYPIDEARPLEGRLIVAPLDRWEAAGVPGAHHQMNVLLECRGLGRTPDLAVQFVLSTGEEGPWPPGSILIIVPWINQLEQRQPFTSG